ncbi:Putative transposase, partial [Anaerovirgula multivorans]
MESVWEERYQSKYGFWRPYITNVIYRYLDCGDPHFGFARVKCGDCSQYLKESVSVDDPIPGAVIAVQTFGEFLNFNPHLHIIASDGCFYNNSEFMVGIEPNA